MSNTNAYEQPLSVEVHDGEIVLRAPNGPFAVSLTPEAAASTAQELAQAANSALSVQLSQDRVVRD